MIEDKIKMFLSLSSFDLAVFVQLIYWERSCQPRRGGGGGDIFLIKPLQPALHSALLYWTTNLCLKKQHCSLVFVLVLLQFAYSNSRQFNCVCL